MHLPNFENFDELNNLIKIGKARKHNRKGGNDSRDPLVKKLLETWEIDKLNLSDFDIASDWTLEYKWYKLVVYIRDQQLKYYTWKWYKFHFYKCQTLRWFLEKKKYDWKYVWHRSWSFKINLMENGELVRETKEDLNVCINCLKEFNYENYKNEWKQKRAFIYNEFAFEKYLEEYDTNLPKTKSSAMQEVNKYHDNWNEMSKAYKDSKDWTCEDCGKNCKKIWESMHTHHIDHNKWNNSWTNYRALCIRCHQKYHDHKIF